MTKLLMLGECMLELTPQNGVSTQLGFAGDTYNAAVYAKRYNNRQDVGFVSCIGQDPFSQQFAQVMAAERLTSEWLHTTESAEIGIYSITTDRDGERHFHYWRNHSAATKLFEQLDEAKLADELTANDVLFFSGISLAILADDDKLKLLALAKTLAEKSVKVVFDLNYRAKMWLSKAQAVSWFEQVFACVHTVLPGLDEQHALFGHTSVEDTAAYYQSFGVEEIVVKADLDGVFAFGGDEIAHQPFVAAPDQVDSTAAGDSFAGTYIAARASGKSLTDSIKSACDVARLVVQHRGAIISDELYQAM